MNDPLSADEARLLRMAAYIKADPGNVRLVREAGELALALGQAEHALPWLEAALGLHPGDKAMLGLKGNLLLAAGQAPQAEAFFAGLRGAGETDPAVAFNLSYAQMLQGKDQEGLASLERIPPEARTDLPRLPILRAQLLYRMHRIDEALAEIEAFLKAFPDDAEALGLRALLQLDSGNSTAAARAAAVLLQRQPGAWIPNYVLGALALETQDERGSESRFSAAVEAAPGIGRAWSGYGFAALMRMDLAAAAERFGRAVQLMPDHLGTWHGLAWTQILLGKLDGARDAIERAMELDRNFAENHGTLAALDAMQGRTADAELGVKRALRLDPRCASAWYATSLLRRKTGDAAGADTIVERYLSGQKLKDGTALLDVITRRIAALRGGGKAQKTH